MGFRQRTAEHGEILRENIDLPAIDGAPAGDDAVTCNLLARHAEVHRPVGDVHVVFFEGTFIQEHIDTLARRQLALGVLRLNALDAAAEPRLFPPRFQLLQNAGHVSSMRCHYDP
ncbi:hypothetical protein D3C78_1119960 [compost metagenome]